MTETKPRAGTTRLKQEQLFALYNWLKAFPFDERKPTDLQVLTDEAARALCFALTTNNMRSAMKVVGVTLTEAPKPASPLQVIARYLLIVCEESGVEVDADLRELANLPAAPKAADPQTPTAPATGTAGDATQQEAIF